MQGIRFENGDYGRRGIVTSSWSEAVGHHAQEMGIVELELNDGKGWRGANISFLKDFPQLQALEILDLQLNCVAPIHALHRLRALTVSTYCKSEIRFDEFPNLEHCALEWRPRAGSLFDATSLRKLFVNRYEGRNTDAFARLTNLESLAILNAPIRTLSGIAGLSKLRHLRLARLRRLESLAGIEELRNLEEFDLNTCRSVDSIEEIGRLPH